MSVHMEQLGPHEVLHLSIFRKYLEKILPWLNPDKNAWYFYIGAQYVFLIISH
jgi:hypothetical protein